MSPLTLIPLNLKGNVYRTSMPHVINKIFNPTTVWKAENISMVVLLCSDQECKNSTNIDLRSFYEENELKVIHFPIPDFGVPEQKPFTQFIEDVLDNVNQGRNILIHCKAGIGRTGMVIACLAKNVFDLDGEQAIQWTRDYISGAVETQNQQLVVGAYLPKNEVEKAIEWPCESTKTHSRKISFNPNFFHKIFL